MLNPSLQIMCTSTVLCTQCNVVWNNIVFKMLPVKVFRHHGNNLLSFHSAQVNTGKNLKVNLNTMSNLCVRFILSLIQQNYSTKAALRNKLPWNVLVLQIALQCPSACKMCGHEIAAESKLLRSYLRLADAYVWTTATALKWIKSAGPDWRTVLRSVS